MDRSEAEVDQETIAAVIAGDVDLYSKLVDSYQGYVFSIAFKALDDRVMAEELTHEIFVKAFFALHGFRGEASFKTWLTRIALNTIRTKLKTIRSTKLSSFVFDSKRFAAVSHSETLETEMREHGLYASIQTLKPKFRSVVELCSLEGRSYQEAADILGVPVGTVCSRMNTALKHLRRRLARL